MYLNNLISLQDFFQTAKNEPMNFQLAYKFYQLQDFIQKTLNFYKENMNNILEQYGQKDEEGNYKLSENGDSIIIKEGCEQECAKRIAELEATEIDISSVQIFKEEDFNNLHLTLEQGMIFSQLIS